MELRPELSPPPVSPERLRETCREIERVERLLLGREPGAEAAIAAFNEATGHSYTAFDFATFRSGRSLEEFALEAARPAHPRVPDVTRAELAEIVRRLMDGDTPDTDFYLRLLDANVARRDAADLVFHPPPDLEDASPEEIVEAMLAHRPFAL